MQVLSRLLKYCHRRHVNGKSDPYIAHLPPDLSGSIAWSGMSSVSGHNKYDLRYSVLHLRPMLTQTLAWGRQAIMRQANYVLLVSVPGRAAAP